MIHSTAPFSDEDVAGIKTLGEPGWIVEPMLDHDTFSDAGHQAFPGCLPSPLADSTPPAFLSTLRSLT